VTVADARDDMTEQTLGGELRKLRDRWHLSLRAAAARADVNAGYLSQLERDEIDQPSPAILQKLAEAYQEPLVVLMRRAGYIEDAPEGLSPNQERALRYMGDLGDEELQAVKAVLDAIRSSRRATYSPISLDGLLSDDDRRKIRGHAIAALRRADALGQIPTPLDQVMEVSRLVAAGEIYLEPELKRNLRARFGDLVDRVLDSLLGAIRFDSREVYLQPGMYLPKRRFVEAHEIGHDLLPWQKNVYAYLDDKSRLRSDCHDLYERQANQAAIELLAQGDQLSKEADDSPITIAGISQLASRFGISFQAAARYVVEESHQQVALAVAYRGSATGKLMPTHLYSSHPFEHRLHWKATGRADQIIRQQLLLANRAHPLQPLIESDISRPATIDVDSLRTPQAAFVLFRCEAVKHKLLTRVGLR